jgi:hypothetical protein
MRSTDDLAGLIVSIRQRYARSLASDLARLRAKHGAARVTEALTIARQIELRNSVSAASNVMVCVPTSKPHRRYFSESNRTNTGCINWVLQPTPWRAVAARRLPLRILGFFEISVYFTRE